MVLHLLLVPLMFADLKERFNRVDVSRTYSLHKDIATLQPGSVSTSMYYKTEKFVG